MPADLHCTVCHRANHPWRKFCGTCGSAFAHACSCGFVNGAEDRFCGGCGHAMRATLHVSHAHGHAHAPPATDNVTMKIDIEELLPAEK